MRYYLAETGAYITRRVPTILGTLGRTRRRHETLSARVFATGSEQVGGMNDA